LCQNAGLDSVELLAQLRNRHHKGEKWAGVDIQQERVVDTHEACVWEPALVKKVFIFPFLI
jgi:T-complex protein 1 subunit eta